MSNTVKILKKLVAEIETVAGTWQEPNIQIPFTGFNLTPKFGLIEDEAIVGVAFKDLPLQGTRPQEGTLEAQVDVISIDPILEAAMGDDKTSGYSLPVDTNIKTLAFCLLDGVKHNKYAGVFVKSFKISSQAGGPLKYSAELLGWTKENRDTSGYPASATAPGTRLQHLHGSGTGYMRMGDQADVLVTTTDDMSFESWELEIAWNFDNQFDNAGTVGSSDPRGTLIPIAGAGGRPVVNFSGKIARHNADTMLAWRDAFTHLQAEFYFYASATAALLIQIPNFIMTEVTVTEDEIAKIDFKTSVARNGTGTSYSNNLTGMQFVTPVKITLTNS